MRSSERVSVSRLSTWAPVCARRWAGFSENEIWREVRSKGQESQVLKSERLYKNRVVVKYEVEDSVLT